MKAKLFSSVALLLVAGSTIAAERAVEAVHYQVDASAEFFDYNDTSGYSEGSKYIAETLHGEVSLPLGPYLGASANASFAIGNFEDDDGQFEIDYETVLGVAQLFYRNPSVGRVSLGYGYRKIRTEYTSNYNTYDYTDTDSTHSYLALVEGYIGPVTVAMHGEREFYNSGYGYGVASHSDVAWASAQWYVVPRARIGLEVGLKDAKDAYMAEIEFQPKFLGNMAGIYVGYMRADDDRAEVNGVRLGVTFYFNKRFDLITRDRHYR